MSRKIIINGRFLIHRVTGVERYAREIVNELDKIAESIKIEMAIPPEVTEIPKYKNIKIVRIGKLNNRLWEHLSLPLYVKRSNAISLNLCNVAPLLSPGIVCIHDVKIKATPQYFSKKFLIWYNLLFSNATLRAKKIITVSEFSKNEIIKYYHVNPSKIQVVPNAWQHYDNVGYDDNDFEKYNLIKGKYYFSMCSLEPNKNFRWIAEVARKNPQMEFAVAGSINETVFADGLGFKCPDNMELLGYVTDEEAKSLMRNCISFIFPTFYEGFGIPPLEAISAGAQSIIVSDTEIMHEIFGDNVNYIDPNNYEMDITKFFNITNEGKKQLLNKYSWEKSAKVLYEFLCTLR